MADGARRSSRARRPAFVDRSDFVDHDAVVRHERQVERQPANDRNRERLTAQRARGEARRESAARNRCDGPMNESMNECMYGECRNE
jgi:hypothetical protein